MKRIPRQHASLAVAAKARNIMKVHRVLAHPCKDITWETAETMVIATTGQRVSSKAYLLVKAKRYTGPKVMNERASVKRQLFFVDVGGPMKHSSLGGNNYAVTFVDDFNRFKVVKLVKKKSDTTTALLSLIADYATPQELSIECVQTENGFELDRRSITHDHAPPDTPQYNEVAERALWLLREKAITLMKELHDVFNVPRESLWAQAMFVRRHNKSVTTSTEGGKSPYEGRAPTPDLSNCLGW